MNALSHMTLSDVKINHGTLQSDRTTMAMSMLSRRLEKNNVFFSASEEPTTTFLSKTIAKLQIATTK